MFLLDEACKPIAEAFEGHVYLVGTAVERQEYRDIDVRVILSDKTYDRLVRAIGQHAVFFLGLAIGQYLASRTDMPIDFQLQRMTEANDRHSGMRNPLGRRTLASYRGDASPEPGE